VPGPIRGRDVDFEVTLPDFLTFAFIPLTYLILLIGVHRFGFKGRTVESWTLLVLGLIWLVPLLILHPRFPIRGFAQKILFLAVPLCLVSSFSWGRVYEPFNIQSRVAISKVFLVEIGKDAEKIEGPCFSTSMEP
jgi:hypothetical protein